MGEYAQRILQQLKEGTYKLPKRFENEQLEALREKNRKLTDNWETYKKETFAMAKAEIPQEEIKLFEHLQGRNNNKKISSKWSTKKTSTSGSVEDAAAGYYQNLGWNVTHFPWFFMDIIARSETLGRWGSDKAYQVLSAPWTPDFVADALIEDEACSEEAFREWVSGQIKVQFQEFKKHDVDLKADLKNQSFKSTKEKSKFIEEMFCDIRFYGAKTLEDLEHWCIKAYQELPPQFFQKMVVLNMVREDGSTAGMPDLFIWNKDDHFFVEVKSPQDRLVFNQAKFYRHVLKPLNIKVKIAAVKPFLSDGSGYN